MPKPITALLVAAALVLTLTPVSAVAQEDVTVVDSCAAVDHFPQAPIGNAPSLAILMFLLTGINPLIGQSVTAHMSSASGEVSGSGVVDMYGVVEIPVPLFQYGTHTVTDLVSEHPGLEHLAGASKGGTFVMVFDVNDGEPTCDADAMREQGEALMAPSTTTTSTSTTSTSTTTSSTSTTTVTTTTLAESTSTSVGPATTPPTATEEPDGANGFPLALALIAPGVLLILAGACLMMRSQPEATSLQQNHQSGPNGS